MSATYTHQGLPEGVKPFDLPDMLQKLRTRLGLRDEDITYIRYLLRKVRADDLKPDRICAVWEAVATQASDLGFHARRITRIATRLESRGLILRTASRGGRRFGRRGPDGRIVAAGGINLGPLIEQASDLLRIIRHEALETSRLREHRDRANDLIKAIRALDAQEALEAARAAFPRLRPSEVNDTERLSGIIEALEAVLSDFSADPGRTVEAARSDSSGRPNTNPEKKTKTCMAEKRGDTEPMRTTPAHVALLASAELREITELYWNAQDRPGQLSWASVEAAARERAHHLGISAVHWEKQCDLLGANKAALCLLIADRNVSRTDGYRVRDAAAAFVGLARKEARQGAIVESLFGELIAFAGGQRE